MNALGKHLLLELRDCDKGKLDDIEFIRINLVTAAIAAGATVVRSVVCPGAVVRRGQTVVDELVVGVR